MRILTTLALAGLLVSTAAPAVTVTFGGKPGQVDQGFYAKNPTTNTSIVTAFTDTGGALGVQDFNGGTGINGILDPTNPCYNVTTTTLSGVSGSQSFGIYGNSVSQVRAKPKGGGSCYAVVNDSKGFDAMGNEIADVAPGSISITSYPVDDNGLPVPLTYAGFLWGSPDSYNYVKFLDVHGNELTNLSINIGATTLASTSTVMGADVSTATGFGINPGNDGTQFVNFVFGKTDGVYALEIGNTGDCCFEFTNYSDSGLPITPPAAASAPANQSFALAVSEPGAAFALVAGLGRVGLARRKRA